MIEEMEVIGEKDIMRITKQCVLLKLTYQNAVTLMKRMPPKTCTHGNSAANKLWIQWHKLV